MGVDQPESPLNSLSTMEEATEAHASVDESVSTAPEKEDSSSCLVSFQEQVSNLSECSTSSGTCPRKPAPYTFAACVQNEPFLISVSRHGKSLFAKFFSVATGRSQTLKLSKTWSVPPNKSVDEEWYRTHLASALIKSRGPSVTPRRPPRRAPPVHAGETLDYSLASETSTSSLKENDIARELRNRLKESEQALLSKQQEFREFADDHESKIAFWRAKVAEVETEAKTALTSYAESIAQKDSELKQARDDAVAVQARESELEQEFSTKRAKIEQEVWAKAETALDVVRDENKQLIERKAQAEEKLSKLIGEFQPIAKQQQTKIKELEAKCHSLSNELLLSKEDSTVAKAKLVEAEAEVSKLKNYVGDLIAQRGGATMMG